MTRAAGTRHGLDQSAAQLARVQCIRALAGDGAQRLRVLGLHDPGAGPQGRPAGQEQGGKAGVTAQIGGQIRHAVREVRCRREAALGQPNRGGRHVLRGQRAEVAQGAAPARQRARHRDGKRTHLVGASRGLPVARQRVGYGLVHRAVGGAGRGAQAVQYYVAAVGQADVSDATTQHPDHHRLDHGEGEQGGHRRIDGVAAGEQHLRARGGGERVVGYDHRPGSGGRLLLAGEGRETLHGRAFVHAGRALLVSDRSIVRLKLPGRRQGRRSPPRGDDGDLDEGSRRKGRLHAGALGPVLRPADPLAPLRVHLRLVRDVGEIDGGGEQPGVVGARLGEVPGDPPEARAGSVRPPRRRARWPR